MRSPLWHASRDASGSYTLHAAYPIRSSAVYPGLMVCCKEARIMVPQGSLLQICKNNIGGQCLPCALRAPWHEITHSLVAALLATAHKLFEGCGYFKH